jgi:fructose-1,6-bisphosphatase/sedoheptulose 1,7-bisphosphatase-like protein
LGFAAFDELPHRFYADTFVLLGSNDLVPQRARKNAAPALGPISVGRSVEERITDLAKERDTRLRDLVPIILEKTAANQIVQSPTVLA